MTGTGYGSCRLPERTGSPSTPRNASSRPTRSPSSVQCTDRTAAGGKLKTYKRWLHHGTMRIYSGSLSRGVAIFCMSSICHLLPSCPYTEPKKAISLVLMTHFLELKTSPSSLATCMSRIRFLSCSSLWCPCTTTSSAMSTRPGHLARIVYIAC